MSGSQPGADVVALSSSSKINLFLEVLRRREDGFHDIDSFLVPGPGEDRLTARLRDRRGVSLGLRFPGRRADPAVPHGEGNLAVRAATLVLEAAGAGGGVDLELEKGIPAGAGLGGGSADAAMALRAVNALLGDPLDGEALARAASTLGSDVPWFLHGVAARMRGRGEILEPLPGRSSAEPLHWLVLWPGAGASTARVYARCEPPAPGTARRPEACMEAWQRGTAKEISAACFNRLAAPAAAACPAVALALEALRSLGRGEPHVTGSGSACFLVGDRPFTVPDRLLRGMPGAEILAA